MRAALQSISAAIATTFFVSCATCKIEPPPTVIGTDKEQSAKIAADALPGKIAKAEASGNYKNAVNETFVAVNQDDVAFYLLLQTYECESSHGRRQQADAILQLAREELARRHGATSSVVAAVASHPATLTPMESHALRSSPLKQEIAAKLSATAAPQ